MSEIELTVKQAAKELRVSPRTVRRWLTIGKLRGRKVDRRDGRDELGQEWRVAGSSVREVAADVPSDTPRRTRPADTPSDTLTAELLDELRSLREEKAQDREQIERLTVAVQELGDQVQALLPPARRSRWERFKAWWPWKGSADGESED